MCNHDKNNKQQRGISLDNAQAHAQDHSQWSRRSFLRQLGIAGTASFLLGKMPLHAIGSSALAKALASTGPEEDRILVLIRLKGGNDGLNTIVPLFDYGTYQSNRSSIAIPQNELIGLTNELAIPNTMAELGEMWTAGKMKVVNNVGYAEQNLSHFRSTDIWSSGVDADQEASSGWLGRLLEQEFPDFLSNPPATPPAIQMGGAGNLVFNDSSGFDMSLNVANPEQLYDIAQTGQLYDPLDVPECHYGEQLAYLRSVTNNTFQYAEVVAGAYDEGNNAVEYENNGIAHQLALVARLIKGGLGTRLYMVVHDGFDTHADQSDKHPSLMRQLSRAVSDFYEDLDQSNAAQRVLSMTFSEFGRRIQQNASGGTDHGAAAPVMLFGEGLNGNGSLGGLPDLDNLDANGNLDFSTDFRQIYATVLEQWLCIEPTLVNQVMGETYERLEGLNLSCSPVSTWSPKPTADSIHLNTYYHAGQLYISYHLASSAQVSISLYNMAGQQLKTFRKGLQMPGAHQYNIPLSDIAWAAGVYVCQVQVGQQQFAKRIQLIR